MLPGDGASVTAVRRDPIPSLFSLLSRAQLAACFYSFPTIQLMVAHMARQQHCRHLVEQMIFATVNFKYPYFLSAIHMVCNGAVGSHLLFCLARRENMTNSSKGGGWIHEMLGGVHRQDLSRDGQILILGFSVVFSLNIAIGNVSLSHVSVNFNQVLRSMIPVLTIAIGMLTGKVFSTRLKLAGLPVIAGVAMACFGNMPYYTAVGLFYTVAADVLGAVKGVASGEMLNGPMKLHPVDLLGYMAPLALVQCRYRVQNGRNPRDLGALEHRSESVRRSLSHVCYLVVGCHERFNEYIFANGQHVDESADNVHCCQRQAGLANYGRKHYIQYAHFTPRWCRHSCRAGGIESILLCFLPGKEPNQHHQQEQRR